MGLVSIMVGLSHVLPLSRFDSALNPPAIRPEVGLKRLRAGTDPARVAEKLRQSNRPLLTEDRRAGGKPRLEPRARGVRCRVCGAWLKLGKPSEPYYVTMYVYTNVNVYVCYTYNIYIYIYT